eukprot:PRCOL_00004189-RA
MSGSAPPGAASAAAGAAAVAVAAAGAYALWARRSAAAADPVVADLNAKTVKGKFMDTFKVLVDEIEAGDKAAMPPNAVKWVREMVEYNVPGGKLNRGLAVVEGFRQLRRGVLKESELFRACALGWCIEWLQAFFLVADDIMDASITRRGQPCWYKVPKVEMKACNDCILLEAHIYKIIKTHFGSDPFYTELLELFHEVTWQTSSGQLLDLITESEQRDSGGGDLERYTYDVHRSIVVWKTAFYSFYLPVACAMMLAGITDKAAYKRAEDICIKMGEYFQVQDDYLDCYGDPEVIGKIGTDIEDSKCSWLVVTALTRADESQKALLQEHYGKSDPASVAKVKALYVELDVKGAFEAYEKKSYEEITALINAEKVLPHGLFLFLLNKIYKRSK